MSTAAFDPTLYLFKSSRRPLYRQQNLHLLAAERGTVVEVAWNRSWVAAEYFEEGTIPRGERVAFVLTDRPYALFAPVRAGEVVEARWEETSLRLWVQLGTWIGTGDVSASAFAAALTDAQRGELPGEKFVAPRRDDVPLVASFDEFEDDAWRRAVDAVLAVSETTEERPYAGSAFFRTAGLRVGGVVHGARREPLARGDEAELLLRFYNPHLTDEQRAALTLQTVASKDSLRAASPSDVPADGERVVELRAMGDAPELTLQLSPNPALHTSLTLRFPAPRTRATPDAGRDVLPVQRDDLLSAWSAARGLADPVRELRLADAFLRLLPDEHRVAERRAVLLHRTGDESAAHEALRALDAERLDDEARFLLLGAEVRRGNVAAAAALMMALDLGEERRMDRLLEELDAIEPPALDRFVRELIPRIADEADLQTILDRVARRLVSPELIATTAERFYLATGDAQRAWSFLQERRRTLRLSHPVIADVAVDLAEAGGADDEGGDLSDLVAHRVTNLIEAGEVDEGLAKLRKATPRLPRDERDRLYHRVADRLEAKERSDEASQLLVELAYEACRTGDIGDATDAVERARGIGVLAGRNTAPAWLREAIEHVEAAWRDVQALDEWRTTDRDRRAEAPRTRFRNRSILVAGGFERKHYTDALEELTGAKIDFAESFRTEGDSMASFADRIRSGRYELVVLRVRFLGHSISEMIRTACADAAVRAEFATSGGLRGIEEALWRAVS